MLKPGISEKDHSMGDENALITLVEFGDYQCPACASAYPIIKNIQQNMGGALRFVFRNYPLTEIHPDAFLAAVVAESASQQNSFWDMHEMLFENQQALSYEDLYGYAEKIGLDLELFKKDMGNEAIAKKVEKDMESGNESGVPGTPSFFINGSKYNGDWDGNALYKTLKNLELELS